MKKVVTIPLKALPRSGIGVGDLVKAVTEHFGIRMCKGCEKRRDFLNRYVVKGTKGKAR